MSREHHRPVVGHLVELVDEDRTLGLQAFDHEAVVHDLVPDIDRPAVALEGALDDLDGAIDAGAEAARTGKQDRERLFGVGHEKTTVLRAGPLACRPADHCLESNGNATGNNMTEPVVAAKAPVKMALEAGKDYWWCACGMSQNQPFCDGSHKGSGLTPMKYTPEKSGDYWLCACKQSSKKPLCDGTHKTLA